MAKLKSGAITEHDLNDFVANDSDFAFEMQVLCKLRELRLTCLHGGTYQDPVTGKSRQFDIRAGKDQGQFRLMLAVECKNLRPTYPLLLSAVPRTSEEAFHELITMREPTIYGSGPTVDRRKGRDSAYAPGDMVGKKTDQVGRENTPDAALVSDDSATFDKLSQAVNSCKDLVSQSVLAADPPYIRAIVPVLAVPINVLWQVDYSTDGTMVTAPRRVSRATLFIGHTWQVHTRLAQPISYCISHLEIITLDAMPSAIQELTNLFI